MENPKEEIAIRAFSMTVLYQISQKFPELKTELHLLICLFWKKPGRRPASNREADIF